MPVSERQVEAEIERASGERVNETRLRLALGAAHMGTWERNLLTGEDVWSPQQQALFGLEPGSFTDRHQDFVRLVHPDDRKGIEESVRRALDGSDSYHSEYRIILPDGTVRWMAGTGDVIRDAGGKPTHMVGVTMDITRRKEAEQRLAAQESRFRALIEKSWDAVAIVSAAGVVQYITPSVTRLLGYAPREFVGTRVLELIHPEDRPRIGSLFDDLIAAPGSSGMTEYRHLHKDGSWRWMETAATNLLSDAAVEGIVANFRDITERKRVEEERSGLLAAEQAARQAAETADRTKDAFLATVSHELRTPLTAIFGWAQLLQRAQCDPDEVGRALKTIERNAKAMMQLVEDVLDVSRIITGKLWLRSETCDLAGVIDAALESVRPAAEAKGLRIERRLPSHPIRMTGDPGRLQQIVWNLAINAVKFTPAPGQVRVELDQAGSTARITVSDNGEGISPEFLPHLFERFTQADNSSRRPHAGLGLGLAIARQLVDLHGGSIRAQSDGAGRGASFTVELPLAGEPAAAQPPPEPERPRPASPAGSPELRGIEILVVDDEGDAREFIRRLLSDRGARVRTASSVAEALRALKASPCDLLLSDIGMPIEDGYDLIRSVRAAERARGSRPLPAAALTAFARTEDRARALEAGFQAHIAKPFEPADLVAVIAQLTSARA